MNSNVEEKLEPRASNIEQANITNYGMVLATFIRRLLENNRSRNTIGIVISLIFAMLTLVPSNDDSTILNLANYFDRRDPKIFAYFLEQISQAQLTQDIHIYNIRLTENGTDGLMHELSIVPGYDGKPNFYLDPMPVETSRGLPMQIYISQRYYENYPAISANLFRRFSQLNQQQLTENEIEDLTNQSNWSSLVEGVVVKENGEVEVVFDLRPISENFYRIKYTYFNGILTIVYSSNGLTNSEITEVFENDQAINLLKELVFPNSEGGYVFEDIFNQTLTAVASNQN